MKNELTILLCLILAGPACLAQSNSQAADYQAFRSEAQGQSMLYRGRQATLYTNIRYNGNYYWHLPAFHEGSVMYNGKLYTGVMLNIDAQEHQLLTRYAPGMPEVIVSRDYVEWFTIGPSRYENLCFQGIKKAAPGYYQVYSEGPTKVYWRVEKLLKSSVDDVNGDGIGYNDPNYNANIHSYFKHFSRYYTVQNGKLKKISRRKADKLRANGR